MKERAIRAFLKSARVLIPPWRSTACGKHFPATVSHLEGLIRKRAAPVSGPGPSQLLADAVCLHFCKNTSKQLLAKWLMDEALRSEAGLDQTLSGSAAGCCVDRNRRWVEDKDGPRAFVDGVGDLFKHKREGMREIKEDREWREEIKSKQVKVTFIIQMNEN